MVNKATEQDLAKIKRLIESALSPREKAMYESLLHKAEKQIAKVKDSQTATKVEPKKSHNAAQKNQKAIVAAEIIAPSTKTSKSTVKSDKSSSPSKECITEQVKPEEKETSLKSQKNDVAMFQAIGVIEGEIFANEKSQLSIALGNQKYRLGYTAKSRKRDYAKLLEEISSQGSKVEKISVYPQVNYKSKQAEENFAYEISFNLVSVEKPSAKENQEKAGIFGYLAVGEFQISGYWQYVVFSSCPCITVMRNYSDYLARRVNKADQKKASRWLRPNHLPVEWLDLAPEPFKYDANLEQQEQMPRLFVQTKVKFEPEFKKFTVLEQIDQPRTQAPRYLKVK